MSFFTRSAFEDVFARLQAMHTHNGKIGRLPEKTRNELNQRLADGEPAAPLLQWLNARPEVRDLLARRFHAEPVSEQNLTNWRAGGFLRWQQHQTRCELLREMVADGESLEEQTYHSYSEIGRRLSVLFAADFALSARELLATLTGPAQRCQHLQAVLRTLQPLRREDYLAERLRLQNELNEETCRAVGAAEARRG